MITDDIQTLYQAEHERILALAFQLTGDKTLAEDILQETFLIAVRHWSSFRGEAKASTWIYRIATRVAFAARSKRTRQQTVIDRLIMRHRSDSNSTARPRQNCDPDSLALYRALDILTDEQRTVLGLLSIRGFTAEQIAVILGIKAGTVYSRAAAARKALRMALLRQSD